MSQAQELNRVLENEQQGKAQLARVLETEQHGKTVVEVVEELLATRDRAVAAEKVAAREPAHLKKIARLEQDLGVTKRRLDARTQEKDQLENQLSAERSSVSSLLGVEDDKEIALRRADESDRLRKIAEEERREEVVKREQLSAALNDKQREIEALKTRAERWDQLQVLLAER